MIQLTPPRRSVLCGAALSTFALLSACAPKATTVSTAATAAAAISTGLSDAIAALTAGGIAVPAVITADLGVLTADAAKIAAATADAPSVANEIESTVAAIADVVLPLVPGGSGVQVLINAAVSLAPPLVAMVGSLTAGTAVTTRLPTYSSTVALTLLQQSKTLAPMP